MSDLLVHHYPGTVVAWIAMGLLLLVQVLVADVLGLRRKKPPGAAAEGGHDDLLWRAERAYGNTNETIAAFVLLSLAAIGYGAHPVLVNGAALTFVAARGAHALCYWADPRLARSGTWIVALLALLALAVSPLLPF